MRRTQKKSKVVCFHEGVRELSRDFSQLFLDKKSPADVRLMHRIAHNVQHLYLEAKELKRSPKHHQEAEHILLSLTTPWGAPFVLNTTLLEAAKLFDEQTPLHSDMYKWLKGVARYGHHFPSQILSMVG